VSYDARGRVVRTAVAEGSADERIVTADYLVGGDPLVSSVEDAASLDRPGCVHGCDHGDAVGIRRHECIDGDRCGDPLPVGSHHPEHSHRHRECRCGGLDVSVRRGGAAGEGGDSGASAQLRLHRFFVWGGISNFPRMLSSKASGRRLDQSSTFPP